MKFNPGIWPTYSPACRKDVDALLKKGGSLSAYRANKSFGLGPVKDSWAERLERAIEKKFSVKHAVACNSGTAALQAAIVGSLAKRGPVSGEIIVSPYTFSASASAILLAGYTPVFADVDPHTFCITKETVKRVLTKKTKAILPVHLFGYYPDMSEMCGLGPVVIEDACQAVGAARSGVFSGTSGLAAAYSFNGGKQLPAGESGAMVTNSDEIAEKARLLANHGENYDSKEVGLNYRINEVTACIAWHGLQELEERNRKRIELVDKLTSSSINIDERYDDKTLDPLWYLLPLDGSHVYYVVPIKIVGRDRSLFCKRLRKRGISVGEGYVNPALHKYPAFRKYQRCPLPVVEELSSKTLCILDQVRPPASKENMLYIAESIREALR